MDKLNVSKARQSENIGRDVRLQGWIRTRRDSKGGFSFLELNPGDQWTIYKKWVPNWEVDPKNHIQSEFRKRKFTYSEICDM